MSRRLPLILFVALLVVPTLELAVVIAVGKWIGLVPTISLLVAESLIGAWIVKREGTHAWRGLRDAINSATTPAKELADAALVLVGGALLLTPGFVTDALGFFCVFPLTRAIARRVLTRIVASKLLSGIVPGAGVSGGHPHAAHFGPEHPAADFPYRMPDGASSAPGSPGVIVGEIVEEPTQGPDAPRRPSEPS